MIILATFNLSSANAFNLVQSKTLSFGKDRMAEIVEQDQAVCMCRLTFPYTLSKINLFLGMARQGLINL